MGWNLFGGSCWSKKADGRSEREEREEREFRMRRSRTVRRKNGWTVVGELLNNGI
jgi:hypothetical protein